MTMGPFSFWTNLNSNGAAIAGKCLAALHWRRSITWSWALYWWPWESEMKMGLYWHGTLRQGFRGFRIPVLGDIALHTQSPMWRRH